jgi:hypothetical protein
MTGELGHRSPGEDRNGTPLEIGVLGLGGDDPAVIHAMRLRPKFYSFISQEKRRP